jgi:TetR/AcrR family transcriptional regulator, transcriptional repressor for nem operon
MVQKSSGRGRPLAFEPDAALAAAMRLFWERGYERTSIDDLEQATGLSRSSLSNTYGTKREIFLLAIDRYLEFLDHVLLGPLETGDSGLSDIGRFVDQLGAQLDPGFIAGCLLTNSLAEFGGRDAQVVTDGHGYLDRARRAIRAALVRAAAAGEIDEDAVEPRTELLLGLVLGINLVARSGVGKAQLSALIAAIHGEIGSWRSDQDLAGQTTR